MPRNNKNKPLVTRSKRHVPVVLNQNHKNFYSGETCGFLPKEAAALVNAGAARFLDDEARQMAERAGFAERAREATVVDSDVMARAEERAAEIVESKMAEVEEKMAAVVSANKKGGAAHAKFEVALACKDDEIAKLREEMEKRGG